MQTWFITGASRGFGLEIARAALAAGNKVIATARDRQHLVDALHADRDQLCALTLDVTQPASVEAAVRDAFERFGTIDVLVNNAGYGQLGAFEEVSREQLVRQFDTNVYGVFDVTRSVLPIMRRQRSGHIITISSIAGMSGGAGSSIYCASKHAISGWSEAMAEELMPFGIKVSCIYPGRFRTDFLDRSSVQYGDITIDDYAEFSAARIKSLDANNHQQAGDPQKFALAIVNLASNNEPPVWLAGGSEGYRVFVAKADALRDNAERWKDVSTALDVKD
ncbi:oxidoreductase [Burkholderia gladioli]|uniref:oxidoreductase n=1 Tax=Burkholderia gladioli TaxID=28095 RepID=UPI000560BECD|nr:oxidoreductase [Burkholderia gladioli]ASD81830.1 short-chain dehydrogenase/reductase [Burkholderia gladioli pv. gladioli]AWY52082.1 short-chain dehydrogenase/reductase [Burkholderia gladioli pv. gladioli]MDJ1165593.1 oxidoreductase [Burkholderia gladioli pv. gladioli]MDN7814223.1 oxidoreductase [Burkholderia gladioli]PRG55077.1 KR domain-containing protein [Burkholderia gladioli]